jgi:hypothetical protein
MPICLWAQIIANEQVFPVVGYSVFERGYPLKLVPASEGRFHYVEFWTDSMRPMNNYYLQTYSRQYAEQNCQPVTKPGQPLMRVSDLVSMAPGAAVIGVQERPDGLPHTVAAFFNGNGEAINDTLSQLSCYDRKPRGNYQEWIKVSPKGRYLLWVCRNGSDHFASLWNREGQEAWHNALQLPYQKEKYTLTAAAVDDDGTPYFLLISDKPAPGEPLILLSYQDSTQQYETQVITPDAEGTLLQADLHLAPDSEIVVTGIIVREGGPALVNGEKLDQQAAWSHVFVSRYDRELRYDSAALLTFRYHQVHPLPADWLALYGEAGANFSDIRILLTGETVVMMMEEQYEANKRWYCYDLALMAFGLEQGDFLWQRVIEKEQRDRSSLSLLSYVAGVAKGKLRLVYLTERGASGKLNCASIDMRTGERRDKYLATNESARYLCFPTRSAMVSATEMVLIGIGNPSQNDYKLITVRF